jgi:hypothetical protein
MYASAKPSVSNIPISLSVIPKRLDTTDFLTTAQLNEMYADNFDVIGHSDAAFGDDTPPAGADSLETTAEIQIYLDEVAIPFLKKYPKNGGSKVWVFAEGRYVYPSAQSEHPDTYEQLLVDNGFGFMRRVNNRVNHATVMGLDELTQLRSFSLGRSSQVDATGTDDTSTADASVMTDSGATFTVDEFVGQNIRNDNDGSTAVVTSNTATAVTGALVGGEDNVWDSGDTYTITTTSTEGTGPCESAADVAAVLDKMEEMGVSCSFHAHTFPLIATSGTQFPRGDWPTVAADLRTRDNAATIELLSLAQYALRLGLITAPVAVGGAGDAGATAAGITAQLGNPNRDTSQKTLRHVDIPNKSNRTVRFSFGENDD